MQDYFEQTKFSDASNLSLQLSFVGTLALVFANLMGPFAQILESVIGPRLVMLIGALLITIGLMMAGFAWQIWHLYLAQGVCFGSGVCFMYMTIMAIAPQYFHRRRGLALGIISSGSGIGGLIIPFIMTPINSRLGAAWTYRVLGFVCLACDLIACVLVKSRGGGSINKARKRLTDVIRLSVLKEVNYDIWVVGAAIQLMGYFVPFFFLPSYASFHGMSSTQGSALVAVAAAMNFVGRILCGIIADKIGMVNTNIIFSTICGLSTLLIWMFAYTFGALMGYMVVFGLTCGSYFALVSPLTASLLGMERFPSGLSFILISNIVSVFGTNIASAIEDASQLEPYKSYKVFSGTVMIFGAIIMVFLKFRLNKKLIAKV
jgi:MFS family permease